MPHYMVSVLDRTSASATSEEMAAIDDFNRHLVEDGHWVFAGGLVAPDTAIVVDGRRTPAVFRDGPFVRSDEYMSGFWIIRAPSLEFARELAASASARCNRRVELRAFEGVAAEMP